MTQDPKTHVDTSREERIKDSIYFGADWCQWHPEYYAGFTGPIHAIDTSHGLSVVMGGERTKAGDLKGADMAWYLQDCANAVPALIAERDALRDQLAAARNEALEEAAKVCTGDEDRPEPVSAAKLRRMSVQDQFAHEQRRLAWKDADQIRALKSTTPAQSEVTVQEAADIIEHACAVIDAFSEYDQNECCDGRECGCRGSSVYEHMKHQIRALANDGKNDE